MKCLSLWQPWASAIAIGAKRIETRSWPTKYRGPIAIQAAKRTDELLEIFVHSRDLYQQIRAGFYPFKGRTLRDAFPFGAIVAVAELQRCVPVEILYETAALHDVRRSPDGGWWTEEHFGNYAFGRFGWILENVRPLKNPIPYRGRQGLFNLDLETAKRCLEQAQTGGRHETT